ncbi:MAG: phycobiliprotein lyase [Snowella sp.]|nr:phycobiliprotein lyase [Snowella sp.]
MMEFFRKSEGTWFSERTVHNFDTSADESGKSNVIIEVLKKEDPRVLKVCQEQGFDADQVSGGASFLWQDNLDDSSPNPNYAAILVDVPNPNNPRLGKFLRNRGYVEGIPVIGLYHFADDGVLTIETEYEVNQGQERSWFINDHFRVRIMTVQMLNGVKQMAYCSERRCVSPARLAQMVERHHSTVLTTGMLSP